MRSNSNKTVVDALVIGGGPAGATAAALLASWGWSVVLIHREGRQPSLAESLPSSTRKLLGFLGQLDAVDAGHFYPNYGNISHWAGKDAVAPTAEPGYHVSRARFDRLLRRHARSHGATILNGQVQRVDVSNAAVVDVSRGAKPARYRAAFVLDASGRTGVVASRGLRRAATGYRTLALAAEWKCDRWPVGERARTFVDSYADGWAWSVPLSATRRQCTVMLDAERTTIRKADLKSLYTTELRKAGNICQRLARCRQLSHPWACDASLYDCSRATDANAILVGDAASFIEPLSSAGVKKALASAWRAAVVVNTCLRQPTMKGAAFDFHNRRERHVYDDCLRRSGVFFREAAAVHEDDFWSSRVRGCSVTDRDRSELPLESEAARDEAVRRTFQRLRDEHSFDWKPAPGLRFDRTAVIEGREIVLRDAVVVPGLDEPVRFWAGVNLPALIQIAAACRDVGSLIDAYHRQVVPVHPGHLVLALSLLSTRGLIVEK